MATKREGKGERTAKNEKPTKITTGGINNSARRQPSRPSPDPQADGGTDDAS